MIRITSFSQLFLVTFLFSLLFGLVVGGLVSFFHRDLGIYLGIFVTGMVFSSLLDRVGIKAGSPGG